MLLGRILIIVAVILFIILAFVTDFGLYLLLSVIMAFVTWLLTKTGERSAGEVIVQIGTAMVVVPMIIRLIVFFIKSQFNPGTTNELVAVSRHVLFQEEDTDTYIGMMLQEAGSVKI